MKSEQSNFVAEVFERRIPQIIGMYVATVWLAVEIGDWMVERFDAPESLSAYIFVGMLSLLPSLILVAWGHGRPGRDRWTKTQLTVIPVNLALAALAISVFVKPIEFTAVESAQSATQLMSMVDEAGLPVAYEVVKEDYHQPVIASFWENKSSDNALDWLSYASAWLIAEDLQRSPVISVRTPYDSQYILDQLQSKGFKRGIGSPLSLDLMIAANRSAKWLIRGEVSQLADLIQFSASLYDVATGEKIKEITASSDDWLVSLDQIAEQVSEVLTADLSVDRSLFPDLAIAEHTSESEKAIQFLISAMNSVSFDNNFVQGVERLKLALEEDSAFANAHVLLMSLNRGLGDFATATFHARAALDLDYKLYQETAFMVKANIYALNSDQDKVLKVLENWVKVYPESTEALVTLARNYIAVGHHIEEAKVIYEKLYVLEPNRDQTLIDLSNIYRLQGNSDRAVELLKQYIALNPDKAEAHIHLAETYYQFGLFDQAKKQFEEAVIFDSNNLNAEVGLVKVQASQGDYQGALDALENLRDRAKTDSDHFAILEFREQLLFSTGRIEASMQNIDESQDYADKLLPPISSMFMYLGKRVTLLTLSDQADKALAYITDAKDKSKEKVAGLTDIFSLDMYEELGDFDKYIESAKRLEGFLEKNPFPNMEQFKMAGRAKVEFWNKNYDASLALYDDAIIESRQSIVTLQTPEVLNDLEYGKSEVLRSAGRTEEAIDILVRLTKRDPLNGSAMLLLAKCYEDLGDTEKRQEMVDKLDNLWASADEEYKDYQQLQSFKAGIATAVN